MNQSIRWISCAVLACAVLSCGKDPDASGGSKNTPADDPAKAVSDANIGMTTPDDVAAPPADALRTEKGVAYKVLKEGDQDGKSPRPWDRVKVHYSGWKTDGELFDSSLKTGAPSSFVLDGVIPGWTDGLQKMKEGDVMRFWIPAKMAYMNVPGRPQGMLVFDVELLKVTELPEPPPPPPPFVAPPAPEDVAGPPKDAKRTRRGVCYKYLERGKGTRHPKPTDTVVCDYWGWQTNGKFFDSSRKHGERSTFSLNQVIEGWKEGIPVMVVGDKVRFWIPAYLAYLDSPGKPQGMLVFDVELFEIK